MTTNDEKTTVPETAISASVQAINDSVDNLKLSDKRELEDGEIKEDDISPEDMKTVFDDATGFNVKHPLFNAWTLWFDNPKKSAGAQNWLDDTKEVITFDSVEEFWGLYNNILPPTHLPQKANYYLFKRGIRPAWEDEANADGGKWSVQFPREKWRDRIDRLWLDTMLSAIGETLEGDLSENPSDDLITGVIISTRPNFYRLAIWTRQTTSVNTELTEEEKDLFERMEKLGKTWKHDVLGFGEGEKLGGGLATEVEFVGHKEGERKHRARGKIVA
ncbi:eukaryotic translation initiation factor 4E class I [Wallemia mellicola]|nr:eukaryotic translation initiation factor 4E class I [Wallemia mellicola]